MRVSELFEDEGRLPDEAPFVLTIIKNLLKKGTEVRVYYKGEGGQIEGLEWVPSTVGTIMGYSVFELSYGLGSMTINDVNLDKLKLFQNKRSSFSQKDMFTLRSPSDDDHK
jgi:hypothetical protein